MNLDGPVASPVPYVIEERRRADPQRDRVRLAVLAEIGLELGKGGDHLALVQRVTEIAVPSLADWCAVDLRDPRGQLERVAIRRRARSEIASPNSRSQLAVPMVVRGRVIGVLCLARAGDPGYDRDDLAFAEELARRVAMYVDHALLLRDQARLIEDLEKMNRELDQFAYIASHDLKAPLRGIGKLAEMIELEATGAMPASARGYLELLRGRTARLEAMIDGVLRYCRAGRDEERPVDVDVGGLARELVELIAAPAQVTFEIADGLPTLHTLRVPLEQVFLNLIDNAVKHGGRPDLHIVIGGAPVRDGWTFFVRDDGPGIAAEHHDVIWGVFRTLASRDRVESTGVGLAIVRRIVETIGGRTWVESTPESGATFHFTWPLDTTPRAGWTPR